MNKNILIGLLLVAAVGGIYLITSNLNQPYTETPASMENNDAVDNNTVVVESTILIKDNKFSPDTLTVKPGQTIEVSNLESIKHTLTSNDDLFDTGLVDEGTTSVFKAPMEPGEYSYHCTLHPEMAGVLIIAE